jgi:hypothetical protein
LLLLVAIAGSACQATATTIEEYRRLRKADRQSTKRGTSTPQQERERIRSAYFEYLAEQEGVPVSSVGQPSLANQFPVSDLAPGTTGLLTFQFIDPVTMFPVPGPAVASVLYEVNLDPDTDLYLVIGSSSDTGSLFSVPFVVHGFEPDIRATPFDASGNPVFTPGLGGFNVAAGSVVNIPVPVPELSTGMLVLLSVIAGRLRFRASGSRR